MDNSVIEINDSITSVESDADAEEGEVRDSDGESVNITAKSPPTTAVKKANNQDCNDTEELVFEVKFCYKDDYKRQQERLLRALKKTFAEEELEFKTNDAKPSIRAYRKIAVPPPDNNDELFKIDTTPVDKLNAAQVPSYKRSYTDVLDEQTSQRKKLKEEEVNKCFRPKMQSACFNCGDSAHSLRDCTRPRNQQRIQRARKKTNSRVDRYHVDAEQRFAHIRPGRIGVKTRHAMGFSRGELPFMFYRMRVLGYPPAWLEEAKVQSSGIMLFNADGSEVQGPEKEEGVAESFKYDVNKIIDFPGFNVQPGAKFYDDFQHHNVPRFQEQQLKSNFIKSLGENITKGYKRKKLIELPSPHDANPTDLETSTNYAEHDMEVENEDGESEEAAAGQPLPEVSSESVPQPPRSPSPSLDDLKAQQAELLEQLESNTSLNTTNLSATELNVSSADEMVGKKLILESTTPAKPSCSSETDVEATPQTPTRATLFKGPSIEGTPLLKFSIYDKLPVGDNFKVGVSDVINFENLPDSTGKYEQMKGLLKNVRKKMERLQNEE